MQSSLSPSTPKFYHSFVIVVFLNENGSGILCAVCQYVSYRERERERLVSCSWRGDGFVLYCYREREKRED